jgi:hypothetical protein
VGIAPAGDEFRDFCHDFPDFLNKKRVFGAKTPAIIQKLSQHIEPRTPFGKGAVCFCLATWLTGFALTRNCYL